MHFQDASATSPHVAPKEEKGEEEDEEDKEEKMDESDLLLHQIPPFPFWQVKERTAFLPSITTSASSRATPPLPFFPSSSTVYVINTPFPQWVAVGGGGQGEGQGWVGRRLEKEQNNAFFHQKFPLFLYLKVFSSEPLERWATMWPHSEHLFTIWNTPPVNWRRQRRGEEKSCVIYDTGPCSYMGSPLHVDSKVWPPYARRLKCVFRK